MRIAVHVTDRVKHRWPKEYWGELIRKLTARGHEVFMFSDDPHIRKDDENPLFHDRCRMENPKAELRTCDLFIGPALNFYRIAKEEGVRAIALLGPDADAEGVKATIHCVDCKAHSEETVDCFWNDELCMEHIQPNDVISAMERG